MSGCGGDILCGPTGVGVGGGGGETLAQTLAIGNATGANDIDVDAGQNIDFQGEVQLQRQGTTVLSSLGASVIAIGPTSATSLQFTEAATVPGGVPGATFGRLWVRSDTPNVLVFTDDTGVDTVLGVTPATETLADTLAAGNTTGAKDIDVTSGQNVDFQGEISIQRQGVTLVASSGLGLLSFANATEVRLDNQANLAAENNGGGTWHNLIGLNSTDDILIGGDAIIDKVTISADTDSIVLQTNLGSGADAKAILTHLNGRGHREFRVDADTKPVLTVEGDRTTIGDLTGPIVQFSEANSTVPLADTGDMRVGHPFSLRGRNSTNAANLALFRWGAAADRIEFGEDNANLLGLTFSGPLAANFQFNLGGVTQGTFVNNKLTLGRNANNIELQFQGGSTPTINQDGVGDATGKLLTIRAQANNSATLLAGDLYLASGDNAGAGSDGRVGLRLGSTAFAFALVDIGGNECRMAPDWDESTGNTRKGLFDDFRIGAFPAAGASNFPGVNLHLEGGAGDGTGDGGDVIVSPGVGGASGASGEYILRASGGGEVFRVNESAGVSLMSFFGAVPVAKQTISGNRADPESALANFLTAVDTIGLFTDSTTAT